MTIRTILDEFRNVQRQLENGPLTEDIKKTLRFSFDAALKSKISRSDYDEIFNRWTYRHKIEDIKRVCEILEKYPKNDDAFTSDQWMDATRSSITKKRCISSASIPFTQSSEELNPWIDPSIAKMTAEILKIDGFVKDSSRDGQHPLRNGKTICQEQGNSEFCKCVVQYAVPHPAVLSPAYLRSQRHINHDLFCTLLLKRVGHAFNQEKVVKVGSKHVCTAGFNEPFVSPMLRDMFHQFAAARTDLVSPDMFVFIDVCLSKAIWHDNLSEGQIEEIHRNIHDETYPYAIDVCSGYAWHSTRATFFRYAGEVFLLYSNRGADSSGHVGIAISKIKNPSKITPAFLNRIASRLAVGHDEYTSLDKIEKELEAERLSYIPMKGQKCGNCVYVSEKANIFALILISRLKLMGNESSKKTMFHPFTSETVEESRRIYKQFSKFDKEQVLQDFLIDIKDLRNGKMQWEPWVRSEGFLIVANSIKDWARQNWGKDKITSSIICDAIKEIKWLNDTTPSTTKTITIL